MKNLLSLFLFWGMATVLTAQSSPYGISVAGREVTERNASNILSGVSNASGTISYDAESHTLRLKDVTLECSGYDCGIQTDSELEELTVELQGTNVIKHYLGRLEFNGKKTVITGKGHLSVTSKGPAIFVDSRDLYIQGGCSIDARGDFGINSYGGGLLKIDGKEGTIVKAKGDWSPSISGFGEIKLVDCDVLAPLGAGVGDGWIGKGGPTAEEIIITQAPKDYHVVINGVAVTEENKGDILGDGKASYDSRKATLTLKDLDIKTEEYTPALEALTWITINVEGECRLESETSAIRLGDRSTITGRGNIHVVSKQEHALQTSGVLEIKSLRGDFEGGKSGLYATRTSAMLDIESSTLTLSGTERGSLHGFGSVTMTNDYIVSPKEAYLDQGSIKIEGGELCTEEVLIDIPKDYPLVISGITVNSGNHEDILGDGTASFDPDKKTLTLDGFKYNATDFTMGINVMKDMGDIVIILHGENEIVTPYMGIVFTSSGVIQGDGSLSVKANSQALVVNDADLTIKGGTKITLSGEEAGIFGFQQYSGSVTFEKANVVIEEGGISNLRQIEFKDCRITEPQDTEFIEQTSPEYGSFFSIGVNGEIYTGKIIISTEPLSCAPISSPTYKAWIEGRNLHIEIGDQPCTLSLYDIEGRCLITPTLLKPMTTCSYDNLPEGTLILRMGECHTKVFVPKI